jgi:hypothetical protein
MRPAMDRICVGVALPVRSALPAMVASALVGGFSGVVFLAILVLPFEGSTVAPVIGDHRATRVACKSGLFRAHLDFPAVRERCRLQLGYPHIQHAILERCVDAVGRCVRR